MDIYLFNKILDILFTMSIITCIGYVFISFGGWVKKVINNKNRPGY